MRISVWSSDVCSSDLVKYVFATFEQFGLSEACRAAINLVVGVLQATLEQNVSWLLREHDGGMRRGLHGVNGERACGQQALDHVAAVVRIGLGIQWRRQANGLQQSTQNPRIMAPTGRSRTEESRVGKRGV